MTESGAEEFQRTIRAGGVVLFPSDTVYGLACDPENEAALTRLYELKGRPPEKASAVMFFDIGAALGTVPELGLRTRAAVAALLPGKVTVLLPNPARRFPLASRADPETLGLRVVTVPALAGVTAPVLQSSANRSGEPEARRIDEVIPALRAVVDLEIDGGELPGVPSTIVDLRRYEDGGDWSVLRTGALSVAAVSSRLAAIPGADATSTGRLGGE